MSESSQKLLILFLLSLIKMDKVLVLLSSYNGESFLNEQLDSIFAQEGVIVHVLIRDDGSSDNTTKLIRERIEQGENITLIEGKNLGFAMSFMALVNEAYNYINEFGFFAFCDQDDVWLPKKLSSAVSMLKEKRLPNKPNLYWSNFTLVDGNLHPFKAPKTGNNELQMVTNTYIPTMTKPTILVRYFMLGCTMVFDKNMVDFVYLHQPQNKITMHDLWLSQTAIFFGNVIYDPRSFLLYRQHGNNAAGYNNSKSARLRRLIKSFKTYERRHFREINAKNLLSAYDDVLSPDDRELISTVADYRKSLKNRIKMLFNEELNMGSKTSDIYIKLRVLLGLL